MSEDESPYNKFPFPRRDQDRQMKIPTDPPPAKPLTDREDFPGRRAQFHGRFGPQRGPRRSYRT